MTDEIPKRSLARKAMRLIPFVGYTDYLLSNDFIQDYRNKNLASVKYFAHAANMVVGLVYTLASISLGTPNFTRWSEMNNERTVRIEQYGSRLNEQLFGTNGVADVNHDGRVSLSERTEALDRVGCVTLTSDGLIQTRTPTINDLQKAIDSYQVERESQ